MFMFSCLLRGWWEIVLLLVYMLKFLSKVEVIDFAPFTDSTKIGNLSINQIIIYNK